MLNIKDLPAQPGSYMFKDKSNKVIYVGKSVNLKVRVSSYFRHPNILDIKTSKMVSQIRSVDYIPVETEVEALILEANLIKKYKPKYNIIFKDDKYYKYIVIKKDKFNEPKEVLRIATSRISKVKDDTAEYFGPFPYAESVTLVLKTLRKIFPFRDCSKSKFMRYKRLRRPCLFGQIGNCLAPCVYTEKIDANNKNIKKFKQFIKGEKSAILRSLEKEMKLKAKNQNYEEAAILRDQIDKIRMLAKNPRDALEYIKDPNLIKGKGEKACIELTNVLKSVYNIRKIRRIEFYDVSNVGGQYATGSMVVSLDGIISRPGYRRFKIKKSKTPNDPAMIKEVLERRFRERKWQKPDLVALDGGIGQLSMVLSLLKENDINIPVIALAKKFETIFAFDKGKGKYVTIQLPRENEGLQLLQRLRDEAHRFAIFYHRKLRLNDMKIW